VIGGKLFKPNAPVKPYQVEKTRGVRDALGIITVFARQNKMIRLTYRKMADGSTVQRYVEPYSIRYLRTRVGGRARYFYAYDTSPPTQGIHSFRMSNILAVEGTNRVFVPRWVVEF
jgi:predicted DNA-binding transcriptional regulator YafY